MANLPAGPQAGATAAVLNITAATVLRTSACYLVQLNVISAGTAGALYDAAATGTATTGRQIAPIPATVGLYQLNWPCASGLVVATGTAQVIAISLG